MPEKADKPSKKKVKQKEEPAQRQSAAEEGEQVPDDPYVWGLDFSKGFPDRQERFADREHWRFKPWSAKFELPWYKTITNKDRDSMVFRDEWVNRHTRRSMWYYKDRMGVSRGPASIYTLRSCWKNGFIDQDTLIWGSGLMDFLPIKNVRTLVAQIRTPEGARGLLHAAAHP